MLHSKTHRYLEYLSRKHNMSFEELYQHKDDLMLTDHLRLELFYVIRDRKKQGGV